MHIPYLSRLLALPFAVIIIFFFTGNDNDMEISASYILLPCVTFLIIIYVFHHQIDHWWWKKSPPPLDKRLIKWLETFSPIYQTSNDEEKKKLENRISVFIRVKDFTVKAEEDYELEADMTVMVAHEFIRITLNREDYLFDHFDKIIVYNHSFPTPRLPFLHNVELHYEDGVIILSREHLIQGWDRTHLKFNIGLYAAIEAFVMINPRLPYPDVSIWNLQQISDIFELSLDSVLESIGLDSSKKLCMMIYGYFEFPEKMHNILSLQQTQLDVIFK